MLCQTPFNYCFLKSPGVWGDGRRLPETTQLKTFFLLCCQRFRLLPTNTAFLCDSLSPCWQMENMAFVFQRNLLPKGTICSPAQYFLRSVVAWSLCHYCALSLYLFCVIDRFLSCLYVPKLKFIGIFLFSPFCMCLL